MEKVIITVKVEDNELSRHFRIIDGQAPQNMQENIDEIVETLLDKEF